METKKLYFKVVHGFRPEDFISIDEDELEMALFAHVSGKKIIFSNGSISGSMIQKIVPDHQKTMGWNTAHSLLPEDWIDIRKSGVDRKFQERLYLAKQKVGQLQKGIAKNEQSVTLSLQ